MDRAQLAWALGTDPMPSSQAALRVNVHNRNAIIGGPKCGQLSRQRCLAGAAFLLRDGDDSCGHMPILLR